MGGGSDEARSFVGDLHRDVSAVPAGAGAPDGSVQFKRDGANLGSPVTLVRDVDAYTTASLDADSREVTATYAGNASFSPSTSSMLTQRK
jgi:Bacterial Ig-like domain (group 3)